MNGMTNACVSFQDQVTGAQGLPGAQWLREEGDGRFHFFPICHCCQNKNLLITERQSTWQSET